MLNEIYVIKSKLSVDYVTQSLSNVVSKEFSNLSFSATAKNQQASRKKISKYMKKDVFDHEQVFRWIKWTKEIIDEIWVSQNNGNQKQQKKLINP